MWALCFTFTGFCGKINTKKARNEGEIFISYCNFIIIIFSKSWHNSCHVKSMSGVLVNYINDFFPINKN